MMYGLHESPVANILDFACCYSLQILIPAILLITTSKRSPLRYLAIPCMIYNASRFIRPFAPAGSPLWSQAIGQLVILVMQAVNLLLLNPQDRDDLSVVTKGKTNSPYLVAALRTVAFTRAINTPRQVRHVPPQPQYYSRRGMQVLPRKQFLIRQCAIFAWQYLAIDMIQTTSRQQAPQQSILSHVDWNVSASQWAERIGTHLSIWFVVNRITNDASFRLLSILFVGAGIDSPADWPPLYGNMRDVYTLRNFWGTFWHQYLRQPLTSISIFICRDVLGLVQSSLFERYTNLFFVFLISAVFHVVIDRLQPIPWEFSGSIPFFLSSAFGIMLEDMVQALWHRLAGSASGKPSHPSYATPFMCRVIGMGWTMAWLGVTSTWYFTPFIQMSSPDTYMVPFGFTEKIGLPISVGAAIISGILLMRVFEIEL